MKTSFWRRWWRSICGAEQAGRALRDKSRRQSLHLEQLEGRVLLSGTPRMVLDINPGAPSSTPTQMVAIDSTTYFAADDGVHGQELWKSDGTAAGTVMVADIIPGSGSSVPGDLTNASGTLFFTANDGVHGNELWTLPRAGSTPSLAVSGFPTTTTAGSAGGFTITAKNPDGTIDTGYTGIVHFTSSDPQAVLPADYTFTATDQGSHTFSVTLKTAGTQSITATDTQTTTLTASQTGITVNPASANTLSVTDFPETTTAGVSGTFTATLRDAYGNLAASYTGTVHFTSSDSKASLPADYTFIAADAGVHTFTAMLKTADTQFLTVTDTTSSSLTGTDGGITVNPASASKFVISAPSSTKAGVPFSLTVTVEDAYGNLVTGYTGTLHFSSTDKRATLPSNYSFTASDRGAHTFTGLVLRTKGSQKITVTDTHNSFLSASIIETVL